MDRSSTSSLPSRRRAEHAGRPRTRRRSAETLAVLHGSRVLATQVNPHLLGIDLGHPPERGKEPNSGSRSRQTEDGVQDLLFPYTQSSIALRLCRFCYLWFPEVWAIRLGRVSLERLGRKYLQGFNVSREGLLRRHGRWCWWCWWFGGVRGRGDVVESYTNREGVRVGGKVGGRAGSWLSSPA